LFSVPVFLGCLAKLITIDQIETENGENIDSEMNMNESGVKKKSKAKTFISLHEIRNKLFISLTRVSRGELIN